MNREHAFDLWSKEEISSWLGGIFLAARIARIRVITEPSANYR
jgi:hypothetical protein